MLPRGRCRTLVVLLVALFASTPAAAQSAATTALAASIDILTMPVSGAGVRSLDFGVVIPGTTVTAAPNTPQSAEFRISGLLGRKSVTLTLTLPAVLTEPGGATIPISFSGATAGACELDLVGVCQTASLLSWDPVASPTTVVRPTKFGAGPRVFVNDVLALYLGATIAPPATQRAGHYAASATVVIVAN